MIKIFGGDTPNVIKVLIAADELGMAYERVPVDIMAGEQFAPEFLAISPNNRVPAMVDFAPEDGAGPLSVFESGAILLYLADKGGALIPPGARQRSDVVAWVMWQMAGQGPMLGQVGHFRNYAPEKLPYAIQRYEKEAARLYRVLDTRLTDREFLSGDYSIADIACWPWILFREQHGIALEDYSNLERWFHAIEARPSVIKAMQSVTIQRAPAVFDEKTRVMLFGVGKND